MPDTYSILLILRIALVAILYLVIIRVVAVARREIRDVAAAPVVAGKKHVVGHLVVIDTGSTNLPPGSKFDIEPITTIGRSPSNTIVLNSTLVSSDHTRIIFRDKSLWVEDINSHNGTWVNQQRIPKGDAVAVTPGMTLQVGDVKFKFAV